MHIINILSRLLHLSSSIYATSHRTPWLTLGLIGYCVCPMGLDKCVLPHITVSVSQGVSLLAPHALTYLLWQPLSSQLPVLPVLESPTSAVSSDWPLFLKMMSSSSQIWPVSRTTLTVTGLSLFFMFLTLQGP